MIEITLIIAGFNGGFRRTFCFQGINDVIQGQKMRRPLLCAFAIVHTQHIRHFVGGKFSLQQIAGGRTARKFPFQCDVGMLRRVRGTQLIDMVSPLSKGHKAGEGDFLSRILACCRFFRSRNGPIDGRDAAAGGHGKHHYQR